MPESLKNEEIPALEYSISKQWVSLIKASLTLEPDIYHEFKILGDDRTELISIFRSIQATFGETQWISNEEPRETKPGQYEMRVFTKPITEEMLKLSKR